VPLGSLLRICSGWRACVVVHFDVGQTETLGFLYHFVSAVNIVALVDRKLPASSCGRDVATDRVAEPGGAPIVLLQGPLGGFFGALARDITRRFGIPVVKVQFNAADVVFDRCDNAVHYSGNLDDLDAWYRRLWTKVRPRVVVCLGDHRPIHIAAKRVCNSLGVPFYSCEEGYFRPNYVTIERGGNNACSPLRHQAMDAPDANSSSRPPAATAAPRHFGSNIANTAVLATIYQILMTFGRPWFPGYQHHRARGLWSEAFYWNRCFVRNRRYKRREMAQSVRIAAEQAGDYYIVALQVFDDLQLRAHGRGWTPLRVIEDAVRSFAENAPAETVLLVKQHPLEVGHCDYAAHTADCANRYGVAARVIYLRYANQFALLERARGMLTINSTLGLAALQFGCPVLTLGDCLYVRPGLAASAHDSSALDAFWQAPPVVDRELATRFRTQVLADTQINGDFYSRKAWPDMTVPFLTLALAHETAAIQPVDLPSLASALAASEVSPLGLVQ
jgi:capsular polysaccharide export protein